MTEDQWLLSENINWMMELLDGREPAEGTFYRPADRKAKFLNDALYHQFDMQLTTLRRAVPYRDVQYAMANLFRCVLGNPFRPYVVYEKCPGCVEDPQFFASGTCKTCDGRGRYQKPVWLTQQVEELAGAAYIHNGKPCPQCLGSGNGPLISSTGHAATGHSIFGTCPRCKGKACLGATRLEPERVALLADALEEAGCPTEYEQSIPVEVAVYADSPRGWVVSVAGALLMPKSPRELFVGKHKEEAYRWAHRNLGTFMKDLQSKEWKQKIGTAKLVLPNPLLAHLRSTKPHTVGCWACDALLYGDGTR